MKEPEKAENVLGTSEFEKTWIMGIESPSSDAAVIGSPA